MYYVMSDIHGCYDQLIKALDHWDPKTEHLVLMGDLVDRGPDSLKVVRKAMELTKKYPDKVTVLKGNHEEMLLSWVLDVPVKEYGLYYNEAHSETLKSFLGEEFKKRSRGQRGEYLLSNFKDELNFMRERPYFVETGNLVFVHAGIDYNAKDWREELTAMLWIRNEFLFSSKKIDKRVFFGHTPTQLIRGYEDNSVWESPCGTRVGIDGGVSMGGQLNALKVDNSGEIVEKFEIL